MDEHETRALLAFAEQAGRGLRRLDAHVWRDRPQPALEAATIDDRLRAVALYENGMLAYWQGDDEEACSLHGRSLELARRLEDRTGVALALCGLARIALHEDLDWARTLCEEALAVVDGTDDQLGRSNALHVLGVAAQMAVAVETGAFERAAILPGEAEVAS
jgi:Tetratricopeptide repeat